MSIWQRARNCDITAIAILILTFVYRLWYGASHELVSDETYYWQWSRHLDTGYYDNTPLLAYVIRLFTSIFGATELGVRFGAVASVLVMSALVYLLARRIFSPQIALVTLLTLSAIPLAADASFLMTQDPVQLMFWAAATFVIWLAVEPDTAESNRSEASRSALWLLGGVFAGLAIMAKLNGLIILPAVFVYVLLSEQSRHWLKKPAPYAAFAIAILIFAPFLWWNHTHGNAYWLHGHAMGQRGRDKPLYPLRDIGDFLGAQAILVSPLLYLTYLRLVPRLRLQADPRAADAWLYLWCCSVSVTIVTAIVSLHNKVEGNWAAAAYVTGIILIGASIAMSWTNRRLRFWHGISLAFSILLSATAFAMPLLFSALHSKPQKKLDRSTEMQGWRELASRVDRERAALGGPSKAFVFGINYRIPSQLAFYLPGHPVTYHLALHDRASNYMFWENPNSRIGQNAVFVNDGNDGDGVPECRAIFARVEVLPDIDIHRRPYADPIRTLQIYRCYGFKGYDRKRWQDGW
ncbi:MAG: glycosyltransferase family 39 protein [Capsulimonadaceae bacterium]|nr:glycosyltransferase family 39 protein [Capsulimonadaceae bacterium]